MKRGDMGRILLMFLVVSMVPFASAGVGIYISQESVAAVPGETACLTYGVYNPFPEDATVRASVSSELESMFVSTSWENNENVIAGGTGSLNSVPIEVCFKVPKDVYSDDRTCEGERKTIEGNIILTQVSQSSGGGSSTSAAVSGPAAINVQCVPANKAFAVIYFVVAIILAIMIIIAVYKRRHEI